VEKINRIALDWGSSRLRAYAVNARGEVIDTRQSEAGVFGVQNSAFESTLRALVGDWLDAHPHLEICAAGMIGSASGWCEAPYVATPASTSALRENVLHVPFQNSKHILKIIPGVRHGRGAQVDVMRGEETQIFGVLPAADEGVFCLPGTHCKWVVVREGAIVNFRTHYTGELYQWLSTQSSVSKVLAANAPFDGDAFEEAARNAAQHPSDLLHQLFALRASVVSRERTGAQAASAAQGTLIGSDIANGITYLRRKMGTFSQLSLVGSSVLNAHYSRVLAHHGIAASIHDADATVSGLNHILGNPA
jgi:2-dehydro-3-deoxygalactonokinase